MDKLTYDQICEYIDESRHSSWEGYTNEEVEGVFKFVVDIALYFKQPPIIDRETFDKSWTIREQ